MSRILTLVGITKSFFLIDTLPFFYLLTEEILTTKFFASRTNVLGYGSPVDKVKKLILFDPSSKYATLSIYGMY